MTIERCDTCGKDYSRRGSELYQYAHDDGRSFDVCRACQRRLFDPLTKRHRAEFYAVLVAAVAEHRGPTDNEAGKHLHAKEIER